MIMRRRYIKGDEHPSMNNGEMAQCGEDHGRQVLSTHEPGTHHKPSHALMFAQKTTAIVVHHA